MRIKSTAVWAALWLSPGLLQAAEPEWTSNVELGFMQTSGNTQTQTLNSKVKLLRELDVWRTTVEGSALKSSDRTKTTSEKYTASLQEDWKFSEKSYWLGRLAVKADRFADIRSRYTEMLGYGYTIRKDETLDWSMDVAAGGRQTQWVSVQWRNDAIVRASTELGWHITPHTELSQKLDTEGGKEGFISHSVTALQQQINETLSSKITFSAEHTSKVAAGIKKLNTETSVTLVWAY